VQPLEPPRCSFLLPFADSRFDDGLGGGIDETVSSVFGADWLVSSASSSDFTVVIFLSGLCKTLPEGVCSVTGCGCSIGCSLDTALFRSKKTLHKNGKTTSPEAVTPIGKQPPGGGSSALD
jgi:hypothetical protein